MNKGPVVFLGVLVILGWSWCGFIYKNFMELGHAEPERPEGAGRIFPARQGSAMAGQEVYRANNCAACHTMQARADIVRFESRKIPGTVDTNFVYTGVDLKRAWGIRPTVLQDFLFDERVFLGSARLGPDLANIGMRQPAQALYRHLYNPRLVEAKSTMPAYPYLFQKRKASATRSGEALVGIPNVEAGYEIVPTEKGKALVAYLLSLRTDYKLFPAPLPQYTTNTVEEEANAPAAAPAPQK